MNDRFILADTEEKFNKAVTVLKNKGFEWVGANKNLQFQECKSFVRGNCKILIHAFENSTNGKLEMQFGYKALYLTYPQFKKGINIINIEQIM